MDDALRELSRRAGISIVVDRRTLNKAGIEAGKLLVNLRADELALASILEQLLQPHQLAAIERHDVVMVTTLKAATDGYYETRAYRITRRVPAERRMRSIMWNVAPTSWVTVDGAGDIAPIPPNLLLIYQSPLRHRQIAERFSASVVALRANSPIATEESSAIEKALAAPTVIDFASASFVAAVEQLAAQHSVPISIDNDALREQQIRSDDVKVSLRAGKVRSLASGLSLLLEVVDPELEWIVAGGAITITTATAAEKKLSVATYQVPGMAPGDDLSPLIEAIQYTVSAASWEDVGGDGAIAAGKENTTLEIRQSYPVQRRLRRLFAALQAGNKDDNK